VKLLRELRKARGLSMKELGNYIGLSESTISLYETGKRQPDYATLNRLADYFGVTTDYLLGRDDKKEPVTGIGDGPRVNPVDARLEELLARADPDTKKAMILLLEQMQKP